MTDVRIVSAPDYFKTGRPTYYKSTKMRSRTEAKVAAELDRLGMDWVYEGDAFAGDGGQYLPDFVVGELGEEPLIIEVKPRTEQVGPALEKMLVVWETDPTATLVVITTDTAFQTSMVMHGDEPGIASFAIVNLECCDRNGLLVASSVGDPDQLACKTCGADATEFPAVFGGDDLPTARKVAEEFRSMALLRYVEVSLCSPKVRDLFNFGVEDDV
jgi:hypothetical protein